MIEDEYPTAAEGEPMNKLRSRLARLESKTQGAAKVFVVSGLDKDADVQAFLPAQGHEPTPRDLVVRIRRFSAGDGRRGLRCTRWGNDWLAK